MPNKSRQQLAKTLALKPLFANPQTDQDRLANELYANSMRMHPPKGPDDPIPWNIFETSPEQAGVNPVPANVGLGGSIVPPAAAAPMPVPAKGPGFLKKVGNAVDDAMLRLMLLGFNPAEFSPQGKKR